MDLEHESKGVWSGEKTMCHILESSLPHALCCKAKLVCLALSSEGILFKGAPQIIMQVDFWSTQNPDGSCSHQEI